MADSLVYLNGGIIPAIEARVSVFDAGLLHGASAFATMLAHRGKVFRIERHLARLMATVELIHLRTEATAATLADAVYRVLAANELSEARVRVTLTPGDAGGEAPTTIVTAEAATRVAEWYEKGITVVVTSFKQHAGDPTCGNKTGSYLPRMLARQEAAAKNADEALWYTADNRLAEACFSNVFLVLGGKVRTPPLDTPVLPGITRGAVLELCRRMSIPADSETPLTVREMLAAEEIFLTSSIAGVRPVVRVERHGVGDERPGEVTRKLMAAYQELLDNECGERP